MPGPARPTHWQAVLCISVTLTLGCTFMHTYDIPETARSGRFVKLTHAANVMPYVDYTERQLRQDLSVHVFAPDDDDCPPPNSYDERNIIPGEVERRGLRYEPGAESLEIDVPVDLLVFVKTLVIRRGFTQTQHCRITIGFFPRDGHEYQYRFRLGSDSCIAEVFDESGAEVPTTDLDYCYQFRRWTAEQEARDAGI